MTRRYYRMRALGAFAEAIVDGHALLTADYEHEGRAPASGGRLRRARRAGRRAARLRRATPAALPDGEPVAVDLYAAATARGAHEALAAELRAAIAAVAWPAEVERVVVAARGPPARAGHVRRRPRSPSGRQRRPGRGRARCAAYTR